MTTQYKTLYETAIFFKDKKQAVHIWMKDRRPDGKKIYRRGFIISINEDFQDRLVLHEEEFGEILILFERIEEDGILPRKKKEDGGVK